MFKKAAMFATLCLASAAHNRLYAVVGAAPSEVQSLIEAKDVRGVYDGLVLIAADSEPFPGAAFLGEFGGNSTRYSLLVHVATEHHGTPAQWKKAVLAAAKGTSGVRVAHQTLVNALVVAGASEAIAVPINTELIPLLDSPMQPLHPMSAGRQTLRRKLQEFKSGVPNPSIVRLISAIDSNKQLEFLDYLSNTIFTRNSYSLTQGGQQAANYIEAQFKAFGFTTEQHTFRSDMTPNVIATLQGSEDPDQVVVVGAHYDSRGPTRDSPTNRAPGANDDGSGTALLLELARIIFESKMEFRFTLIIGAWSGEEQGLIGSRAYAQRCKQRGMNIIAMLQSDMVAYRRPGENIQCAFPTRFADQVLTDLAMLVMGEYVPDLQTCYTTACCSDHQSFTEQGYSATQHFERCGAIADPMYHQAGDVVNRDGYDVKGTLLSISKGVTAVAAHILEPLE